MKSLKGAKLPEDKYLIHIQLNPEHTKLRQNGKKEISTGIGNTFKH